MRSRIVAGLWAAFASFLTASPASAAVWHWGCQGQLGEQQVIFNRYSMVIVDSKRKLGDIRKLNMETIELPPGSPPNISYAPVDVNGGLEKTMIFTRKDNAERKVTLTEKSTHRISHKHKLICGRDEDTDIFRKVYLLQREDEPARDITMQCMEYQLSTRGGRPCN